MKKLLVTWFALLLLVGCGGGETLSGSASSTSSTSSGSSTSSTNSSATAAVATVTLVSSRATIPSDGSASATLTAYVRDSAGGLLDGVAVSFVIPGNNGGITPTSTVTSAGVATATLITAGDSTLRTISVTTVAGGVAASTTVQVVSATSTTSVQLGSGTGTGFQAGVLNMGVTGTLSAGGTTVMTATLVQSDGSLYTGSTAVTFSSTCIAAGTATIQEGNTITTTTGSVSATYQARGCTSDTVTARATVGGVQLSATGQLTIAQATVGSIIFVSATPSSIALKGAGSTTMPEVSNVKFQVLDSQNNALPNRAVTFALNTSVGGVALTSTTATSDSSGNVTAIVNSGTVATSVRVTATVTATAISTQSSNLTITTGLPDQDSFSLAMACNNLEAWNYDGVTTTATVFLADRYNNPVPDNTAITFQTEAGDIGGSCTTSGGSCNVTWRSSGTRPGNGRVSILASAIGEETFVDVNGNGVFDAGDSWTEAGVATDFGEPFQDNNENGIYDSGEPFRDFNLSGTRNGADGAFNGYCSTGVANCSATQSTAIGAKAIVVMSGNAATIVIRSANDYVDGGALSSNVASIALGAGVNNYYVAIYDLHGNPMPAGTTVTVSTTNGTLSGITSYTVGCTAISPLTYASGTTLFPVILARDTTSSAGALTITVTTPKGTITTLSVGVTD